MDIVQPITTGEAARILRVAEDTARRWGAEGRLRVVRTSAGLRIFDRADVERLARERQAAQAAHG
jgi:excisionase family DNA binding protein